MSELTLSTAIWSSVKPILKIYLILITGFILARKKVLNIETSRNLSDFVISVALPGLTFSKIVSSLSYKDLKSIGVLIFVEALIILTGAICGFVLNYVITIPKYFYYGLIVSSAFTNVGDLPIAFIQGIPSIIFDSAQVNRGVAYVCILNFCQVFTLFNLGALHIIGLDFPKSDDNESSSDNVGKVAEESSIHSEELSQNNETANDVISVQPSLTRTISTRIKRRISIAASISNNEEQTHDIINEYSETGRPSTSNNLDVISTNIVQQKKANQLHSLDVLLFVIRNFKRPASLSIVIGMIVALVPWLKALFVPVDSVQYSAGPDQNPPLSFILDTATFIGNSEVPLGLLLLGGTLGRLQFTKNSKKLIIIAVSLLYTKLIMLPIIGISWMGEFHKIGWITSNMEYFLCILSWGLPGMTTQIYITAFYTPLDGEHKQLDIVGILLMSQYIFLIISFPILVTYTLKQCLHF